jgi:hypothetical protein
MKVSQLCSKTGIDAQTALMNSGTLVLYSGTQPTNPDTALSGNTALATFTLGATAFGAGTTANPSVAALSGTPLSATAGASATATFGRFLKSDGTTVVADVTIGTSGSDINLNSTSITSGGTVTITSYTWSLASD